jgi:hypothetical protein
MEVESDVATKNNAAKCMPAWMPTDPPLSSAHPEIGKLGRDQGVAKNLSGGIWLIFRGLNFSRNTDIGQIGHFWMGTI